MSTVPTDAKQIALLIDSVSRLREKVDDKKLPVLTKETYLRPVPGGCSILSINPTKRPQQGITKKWSRASVAIQSWITERDEEFKGRTDKNTRVTPEKALQSFLIGDAIVNNGQMNALLAGCRESPRGKLRFLIDEVAFRKIKEDGKDVFDLMAIRSLGDVHTMVAIELKSNRQLTRIKEQVNTAASFMERNRLDMERLVKACWGETIRLADKAERWIVWKANTAGQHGDADPHAASCRAEGIRLVTYDETPTGVFSLHAASASKKA